MRRVPDSAVSDVPLLGINVIGPTVTSKLITRSAGASPILSCTIAGVALPNKEPILVFPFPPQLTVTRTAASTPLNNKMRVRLLHTRRSEERRVGKTRH